MSKYDPIYQREYYLRTRKLKGRKKGSDRPVGSSRSTGSRSSAKNKSSTSSTGSQERVARLKAKVSTLQKALSVAQAELSKRRQAAVKEKKQSSDGKSTAAEKKASKEYRERNREKIASERRKESSKDPKTSKSSSGGGSSKSSSSNSVSDMGIGDLEARISKIKTALAEAKRQLSNASIEHGALMHSAILSEPTINERFARFRSAERIPSK